MKLTGSIICLLLGITVNCNGMDWAQSTGIDGNGGLSGWTFDGVANTEFDFPVSPLPLFNTESEEDLIEKMITDWKNITDKVPQVVLSYYLKYFKLDPSTVSESNLREFLKKETQRNVLNGAQKALKEHWDRVEHVRKSFEGLSEEQMVWFTKGRLATNVDNSNEAMHFFAVPVCYPSFNTISSATAKAMGMNSYADQKQRSQDEELLTLNKDIWNSIQKKIQLCLRKNDDLTLNDIKCSARKLSSALKIPLSHEEEKNKASLGLWYINNMDIIQPHLEGNSTVLNEDS